MRVREERFGCRDGVEVRRRVADDVVDASVRMHG